ncbi:DUF6484 domain-containing protein [Myxococcus sp. RHSTA-1-4]|uniref:DUF6484 domain-containing protein n=1 Tax=Myxococcus sp. RHSTA-1-4 TaxID=2874601 RepID=UPI001CBBD44D|nr:DUF6484 domain-containing protein [Myxococcus sp. RHSTA-1-4]MBZ4421354.1 DUF6484 domain-containing protein [Myxococcus sp. RHSTA-1-4]
MLGKPGSAVSPDESTEERHSARRGPRFGWISGVDARGGLWVDFPGNPAGPLSAHSLVSLGTKELEEAVAQRRGAFLLFEDDDLSRPVLAGLSQPVSSSPLLEALLEGGGEPNLDARVDGRRVVLEGKEEVVLRCGEASITLRRNGKVLIRGVQVETHAAGTNRIKGASVKVN